MTALRVLLLTIVFAGAISANAADPQPQIRVELANKDDIWVGQRVTLNVTLLAPGTFASAPSFDLPRLPGVMLLPPSGSPVLGTETIEDVSYTTQLHEVALISQRDGEIEIPAFTVRFGSAPAFNQPAVDQTVTSVPLKFTVKMPPGVEGLSLIITTSDLTVTQSWNPQPADGPVKHGSAFTRTITAEASDMPAMLLPAFPHDAPPGMKAYPQPPVVEDHSDRGATRGKRVDAVTFVLESPGTFELPPLAVAWWDPQAQKLNRIDLPGQTFEVIAPSPPAPAEESRSTAAESRVWKIATILAIAVAIIAASFFLRRTHGQFSTADSEAASFEGFQHACRMGDPHSAMSTLLAWIDRAFMDVATPTTDTLIARCGDPALAAELTALEDAAYGRGIDSRIWSPTRTLQLVRAARWRLRHSTKGANRTAGVLPPLNP